MSAATADDAASAAASFHKNKETDALLSLPVSFDETSFFYLAIILNFLSHSSENSQLISIKTHHGLVSSMTRIWTPSI